MLTRKEEKHSALLQAALELFAEQGLNGTSTALIARKAGVASGTLFFHFKSKDALIHTLYREIREKIDQHILESCHAEIPVRERYLRTFSKLLRYFLENPQEFKFMEKYHYSPLYKQDDLERIENDSLKNILIQAREQKLIKDAPLLALEAVVFGPIVSLAKQRATCGTPIDEETVSLTVEAGWDGLKR